MTDVEKKLAEYRAKRARSDELPKAPGKLMSFFSKYSKRRETDNDKEVKEKLLDETVDEADGRSLETSRCETADVIGSDKSSAGSDIDDSLNCCTYTDLVYYGLCLVLWAIVWSIFIKLQFGTVYFISSGLIGIYLNTGTRPKRKDEISAYSVFNKDCKSIDGTLKAEQFEREIRYGPMSSRM